MKQQVESKKTTITGGFFGGICERSFTVPLRHKKNTFRCFFFGLKFILPVITRREEASTRSVFAKARQSFHGLESASEASELQSNKVGATKNTITSGFLGDICEGSFTFPLRHKKNTFRCFFFGDSDGTRTHDTAVKGRCLNHLTTEPNMKFYW